MREFLPLTWSAFGKPLCPFQFSCRDWLCPRFTETKSRGFFLGGRIVDRADLGPQQGARLDEIRASFGLGLTDDRGPVDRLRERAAA